MQRSWAVALFSLAVSTVLTQGASLKAHNLPAEVLESDAKFNKDLRVDDRPQVGTLHFKHPYPTVQDSEDFDKDFVKDQNTDNGEYTAQSEYDSQRHIVSLLKQQAKVALARKNEEQKDLDGAYAKYKKNMDQDKAAIAKKQAEKDDLLKSFKLRPMPVAPVEDYVVEATRGLSPMGKKTEGPAWWPFSSWGKTGKAKKAAPLEEVKVPEPVVSEATEKAGAAKKEGLIAISEAEKAIEQAAERLKEAEKELADAEANLKKLNAQLEAAQKKLVTAHLKVIKVSKRQEEFEASASIAKTEVTSATKIQAADQAAADKAYAAQKAIVDKLKKQTLAASNKVKSMRAAEDKDGGVYPVGTAAHQKFSEEPKSGANSIALSSAIALAMAVIALA